MKLLVATDIFGATPALLALARHFAPAPVVVSPYGGAIHRHTNEDDAYAAFLKTGGIDAYAKAVASAVARLRPDAVIGFSAGATAAWLALANPKADSVTCAVLFYGARIRDHLHVRPHSAARLVFAEHEPGFEAATLVATLRRDGVDAGIVPGTRHGFMNPRSPGYDAAAMRHGMRVIAEVLDACVPQAHHE